MAVDLRFHEEDMAVDEGLGYPKAYAKLCRDGGGVGIYCHGPPFTFTPYALHKHQVLRAMELDKMFPVINPKAKPTTKPKIFVGLLWKQLNHLGNAGFDPAVIRVDPYGNVVYFHADKASPLAWDIDHWFPYSRGGLTVPSNLRILQWQVCKRKHNKLEFLVPWWDLQLGISVNHFLSVFASSNSDFRRRAFSFLFAEGESEELNGSQTVESHSFPQHFVESKQQLGLAPAAIVISGKEIYDSSLALKSLDYNRQIRSQSPLIAARKVKPGASKENENPDFVTNPYHAIVMARDSLKQREEAHKMQAEIQKLDNEVDEIKTKNDEERVAIQDLELQLIKRRRRAEKCRRLAEAQSSYRTTIEKMIRDAMHQSVVYKEQVRLNQVATNALMARLEAQKAICDSSEKELYKKFKQRDELEKQIKPEWEQARKRLRVDETLSEDRDTKTVLYLPGIRQRTPLHKELRVFLEEEQKASEAGLSPNEAGKHEGIEEELGSPPRNRIREEVDEHNMAIVALENEMPIERKLQALAIGEESRNKIQFPVFQEDEPEEDEESRKQRGKGNVERWLQMLLESSHEEMEPEDANGSKTDDMIAKLNQKFPQKEVKSSKCEVGSHNEDVMQKEQQIVMEKGKGKRVEEIAELEADKTMMRKGTVSETRGTGTGSSRLEGKEERIEIAKEKVLVRSESARTLLRIPSSPSLILGIKKGVECMGKKPTVTDDDDWNEEHHLARKNSFIKSIKSIKKVVKI